MYLILTKTVFHTSGGQNNKCSLLTLFRLRLIMPILQKATSPCSTKNFMDTFPRLPSYKNKYFNGTKSLSCVFLSEVMVKWI